MSVSCPTCGSQNPSGYVFCTTCGARLPAVAAALAFDVAQSTREIGIRSALGAERRRLLASVLLRGVGMAVIGVFVGLAVTWVAAPYAGDLLFRVSPRDPLVLGAVGAFLLAVGVAASLLPGLRATRVDAMEALRAE